MQDFFDRQVKGGFKMRLEGVNTGIVLDHIKAGTAMKIYNLLELEKLDCTVAVMKNVASSKMGKKDMIKIDTALDLNMEALGYLDNKITVNIVKDGKLAEKKKLSLPKELNNVIKCKNPRCITSVEQEIKHSFRLVNEEKKVYRCSYCDATYTAEEKSK